MAKIKTITMKVADLIGYEQNPRRNDKAVSAVVESIKKFGMVNPILINKDNVILAGHTRLKALQKLGVDEVQCVKLTHLTEEEEKAFRIADNRVAEYTDWDADILKSEMQEIKAEDWEAFGFTKKVLDKLQPPEMCTCPKCGKKFYEI